MKRKAFIILSAIILLLATSDQAVVCAKEQLTEESDEKPQADTELIFNPDSVINKTVAKSALADMHGVFVFRDAFITQEAIVKERERRGREDIEYIVLTSEQPDMGYQEWVDLILLTNTEKYIKDVYIEEKENTLFIWIYCIILSICALCGAIRMEQYLKQRKKGQEKAISYEIKGLLVCFMTVFLSLNTACNRTEIKNMECVLELEENEALWIEKGNESKDHKEFYRLYISRNEELQMLSCDGLELATDEQIVWEYEDIDEDGRKDIVITTQEVIWVLVQDEDGNYAIWEDEPLQPIFKNA